MSLKCLGSVESVVLSHLVFRWSPKLITDSCRVTVTERQREGYSDARRMTHNSCWSYLQPRWTWRCSAPFYLWLMLRARFQGVRIFCGSKRQPTARRQHVAFEDKSSFHYLQRVFLHFSVLLIFTGDPVFFSLINDYPMSWTNSEVQMEEETKHEVTPKQENATI